MAALIFGFPAAASSGERGQGIRVHSGGHDGLVETSLGLGPYTGLGAAVRPASSAAEPEPELQPELQPEPQPAPRPPTAIPGQAAPSEAAWYRQGENWWAEAGAQRDARWRRPPVWEILPQYRSSRLQTEFALDWIGGFQDPSRRVPGGFALSYPDSQPLSEGGYAAPGGAFAAGEETGWRRGPDGVQAVQPAAVGQRSKPWFGEGIQARLSATYTLPATAWWDGATWIAEIGRQRQTGIPRSAYALVPSRYRQNRGMQLVFTPTWSQVLPRLDLSLPLAIGYSPQGQTPLPGFDGMYKGAKLSLGISAVYAKDWNIDLRYMHFFRPEATRGLPDRDFVSLFVTRSF